MLSLGRKPRTRWRWRMPLATKWASKRGRKPWQKSSTAQNNSSKLIVGLLGGWGFRFGDLKHTTSEESCLSRTHVNYEKCRKITCTTLKFSISRRKLENLIV